MRIVIVAWLVGMVTLVVVALAAVVFWTECADALALDARYFHSADPIEKGWRFVASPNAIGGGYYCRPWLYRLLGD